MNIHAQGRLLAKYELVTPNSLRDGAIQKSTSPGCSFRRDSPTKSNEPQILTQVFCRIFEVAHIKREQQ